MIVRDRIDFRLLRGVEATDPLGVDEMMCMATPAIVWGSFIIRVVSTGPAKAKLLLRRTR
jgi:hypothetical protein